MSDAVEVDGRESDGIIVRLYHSADTPDRLALSYVDTRTGDAFLTVVPANRASDALAHPNVYRGRSITLDESCCAEALDASVLSEFYVAEFGEMLAPIPLPMFPADLAALREYGWEV